jgi:hypothetical protein
MGLILGRHGGSRASFETDTELQEHARARGQHHRGSLLSHAGAPPQMPPRWGLRLPYPFISPYILDIGREHGEESMGRPHLDGSCRIRRYREATLLIHGGYTRCCRRGLRRTPHPRGARGSPWSSQRRPRSLPAGLRCTPSSPPPLLERTCCLCLTRTTRRSSCCGRRANAVLHRLALLQQRKPTRRAVPSTINCEGYHLDHSSFKTAT